MTIKSHEQDQTLINPETEVQAIIEFVKKTWDTELVGVENAEVIIRTAFFGGLEAAEKWCDNSTFFWAVSKKQDAHEELLEGQGDDSYYDAWRHILSSIFSGQQRLKSEAIGKDWDYSGMISKLVFKMTRTIKNAQDLKPLGYGDVEGGKYDWIKENKFEDFMDFGYFDDQEGGKTISEQHSDLFQGHYFAGSGCGDVVDRISMHYVMQSDVNQGRASLNELIGGIFSHGMYIREHNNTCEAVHVIRELVLPTEFTRELPELPDNKFIRDCYNIGTYGKFVPLTDERKAEIAAHKAKIAGMSTSELIAHKLSQKKQMKSNIDEILKELNDEEK